MMLSKWVEKSEITLNVLREGRKERTIKAAKEWNSKVFIIAVGSKPTMHTPLTDCKHSRGERMNSPRVKKKSYFITTERNVFKKIFLSRRNVANNGIFFLRYFLKIIKLTYLLRLN